MTKLNLLPSYALSILVIHSCVFQSFARRRSLHEITYRLTNCGSTTYSGPRLTDECLPLYSATSSPIANPRTLFKFEDGSYDGAQGFQLPRDDLYNITVAGASGGEGVCNYHYGLGGVISAQVRLTTDYEYLIMVGHRGTSVCDVPENTNHPICQLSRPTNLNETKICQDEWVNWTAMFATEQNRYNFNGGGGGGGASMIWPRRADNKEFTDSPILISPGGGGAAAVLDYPFLASLLTSYNLSYPISASNETKYTFHTSGHFLRYALEYKVGARGFRVSRLSQIGSGAGGGWSPLAALPLFNIDGKLLSRKTDFAEGGFDCSLSLEDVNSNVFSNVFGGYGGGGGGCGSGGGGGGYTGGHVFGNINRISGGGGDAGVFNITEFPLLSADALGYNDGDGYVEIVASNCGCDGECVVYTEEGQFECQCPNDTLLAQDETSCYQEINVTIIQVDPISFTDNGETFFINGLQFENSSLLIFGLDVSLTVSPSPGSGLSLEEVACAVVFVGQNSSSVLASNPVRASTGKANLLSILEPPGNGSDDFNSDYTSFLSSPILVTGAFLLTNGECSLASPLRVNISPKEINEHSRPVYMHLHTLLTAHVGVIETFEAIMIANRTRIILGNFSVEPTSGTDEAPSAEMSLVIGTAVGASALFIVLLTALCIVLLTLCTRSRSRSKSLDEAAKTRFTSLIDNLHYSSLEASLTLSVRETNSLANYWKLSEEDRKRYEQAFSPILVPSVSLTVGKEIGQGAFGTVYEGTLKQLDSESSSFQEIAVKTTKNLASQKELKAFLDESLVMSDFHHPNILGLTGVCFDTPDGVPFILLPLMTNGSLKDYLKKKRTHVSNVDTLPEDLKLCVLVQMCMDIASGMEYLAGEKFVHRDLAARNCMVDSSLQIKVGDFGLARDIYNNDYYRAGKEAMLPVKWMAPETLLDGISNEKTDVWSYGVTCWEVFSLGRAPYPGIQNQDVLMHVAKHNQRLEIPTLCPAKMYDLAMSQCWQLLPEERLTFSQLVCQLQEYWEEEHAYVIETI